MSTDETYNGWTNRETWAVALHINNDQGWQERVTELLTDERDIRAEEDQDELEPWDAGELIREDVEDWADVESLPAGLMGGTDPDALASWAQVRDDIGSLWRVDWRELGAAFLADMDEERS